MESEAASLPMNDELDSAGSGVQTGSEVAGQIVESVVQDSMAQIAYTEVKVRGYEAFCQLLEKFKDQLIFTLFCGSKNTEGVSWCPDCVKAEPIVRVNLQYLPEGSVFIYCDVGEREYWKDPSNGFKQNLNLTAVPTLLKCGTPQKLVEEECCKPDLVQMLFTED